MKIRRSEERGYFENEWLKSFHSFSFGEYFDRQHMHFSDLRVINHDMIAAATGFPLHPHKDMEIITYVIKGAVEHQDSMGNKAQVRAGEIQVMGAGTGVFHSEYNPLPNQELELLQIWVMPSKPGGNPHYSQKKFTDVEKHQNLLKIVSGDKDDRGLPINQKTNIYATVLQKNEKMSALLNSEKSYWLQMARGSAEIQGKSLKVGDALNWKAGEFSELKASASEICEFLLFELRDEAS